MGKIFELNQINTLTKLVTGLVWTVDINLTIIVSLILADFLLPIKKKKTL